MTYKDDEQATVQRLHDYMNGKTEEFSRNDAAFVASLVNRLVSKEFVLGKAYAQAADLAVTLGVKLETY